MMYTNLVKIIKSENTFGENEGTRTFMYYEWKRKLYSYS